MPYIKKQPLQDGGMKDWQGPGGSSAPAGTAAPSSPGMPSGEKPGQFVNLRRYLDANQGGAKAMADKLAAGVEDGATNAEASAGQSSKPLMMAPKYGLQQAVQKGPLAQGVANRSPLESGQTPALDPNRPGAPPRVQSAAAGMAPPKSETQLAAGYAATDKAEQQAGMLGTMGGRQQLLTNAYGQQSQGGSDLDNFLAGSASGGRFGELSKKYSGLTDKMMQANAAYGTAYTAEQKAKADAAAELSAAGGRRAAANKEASEARTAAATEKDAADLGLAKRSGYNGDDVEGARSWYAAKYGAPLGGA